MSADSLAALCLLLFLDGATFSFFTTILLLRFGQQHPPWLVAVVGGAASGLGSVVQFLALRWALGSEKRWMRRLAPSREKLTAAVERYRSASFLALLVARATPLPDAPLKLVAAAAGYPAWRYFLAVYLGALPYYFALAAVGHAVHIPGWILVAAAVLVVVGVLVDRLRPRRRA